jgi:hypothetical protein
MNRPALYVQAAPYNNNLAFDFCYSAKLGAQEAGIEVSHFANIVDVPPSPYNIIVGSVEVCTQWLAQSSFTVPPVIDLLLFKDFLGRQVEVLPISQVNIPAFIKPAYQHKAFTGFIADSNLALAVWSEGFQGDVISQQIIDIKSEYRMYINCQKIIGMKHYSGDCLLFPNSQFITSCVEKSYELLDNHSYTLDFGVLEDGTTVLIEPNDGWAVGNYGLDPLDYYYFVRNRWLQLTGVRTRMEHNLHGR